MKHLAIDLTIVLAAVLFMCAAAHSQELPNSPGAEIRICYDNADDKGTMEEIPCDQVPKGKVVRHTVLMPKYEPKKFQPWKVFYDIHEHPKRTQIIWLVSAGVAGGMIAWFTREHCDKYEAGHNGVGVDCPVEYKK